MNASPPPWRFLVFGGSGAIGNAICQHCCAAGWDVVSTSRSARSEGLSSAGSKQVKYDPIRQRINESDLATQKPFDAVCWAQGANLSDSPYNFDVERHLDLYRANCLFILRSMSELLDNHLLRPRGARLCIVSSIWQEKARQDKLSYTVTKAALGGLVRAASIDLAGDGHLVNAVLPGVLETPMTRANLSREQITKVEKATRFDRLADLPTLLALTTFLSSENNQSITGQSIAVDLGFNNARVL